MVNHLVIRHVTKITKPSMTWSSDILLQGKSHLKYIFKLNVWLLYFDVVKKIEL